MQFVTVDLIKQDIEKKYNYNLIKLDKLVKLFKCWKIIKFRSCQEFWKEKKKKNRLNLVDFSERNNQVLRNQKIQSLIDFDEEYSSSTNSIALEQSVKVNSTTRFLNGKMLMFSKVSIKSFVYDLIDVFMRPNEDTR